MQCDAEQTDTHALSDNEKFDQGETILGFRFEFREVQQKGRLRRVLFSVRVENWTLLLLAFEARGCLCKRKLSKTADYVEEQSLFRNNTMHEVSFVAMRS